MLPGSNQKFFNLRFGIIKLMFNRLSDVVVESLPLSNAINVGRSNTQEINIANVIGMIKYVIFPTTSLNLICGLSL